MILFISWLANPKKKPSKIGQSNQQKLLQIWQSSEYVWTAYSSFFAPCSTHNEKAAATNKHHFTTLSPPGFMLPFATPFQAISILMQFLPFIFQFHFGHIWTVYVLEFGWIHLGTEFCANVVQRTIFTPKGISIRIRSFEENVVPIQTDGSSSNVVAADTTAVMHCIHGLCAT